MEQAIEEGGDRRGVAEELAPVIDGAIGRQQRGRAFVAPHDQFEQIFGRGVGQLAHTQVVDDEERDGRQRREVCLACIRERGLRDLFQQRVGFPIEDAVALLNDGASDGLGEMALARAGWAEEEDIFPLADKPTGGKVVHEAPIHLLVEIKVEAIEGAVGIAEARLFVSPFEQTVLPTEEFVGDERRHQIDRAAL